MKKKLEEKLAMLAFGDMDPEETARLQNEVAGDREAMAVLAQYRGMRTGLRALGDIPEHQLSSERLRHAVLNRGLKPKRAPQFGWLWMPAAAFAVAFGAFMVVNGRHSPLAGITKDPTTRESTIVDQHPETAFALATASGEIMSVGMPAALPASFNHEARRRRMNSHLIDSLKARVAEDFDNLSVVSNYPGAARVSAYAPVERSAPETTGTAIVMIGSSKDVNTGAQKATEVDGAGDVVVGG